MGELSLVLLFLAAIPVGVMGIVIGGAGAVSVTVFQVLFPDMALGAVIGNIKLGSAVRSICSLISLRKDIEYRRVMRLIFPLGAGTALGAMAIAHISQFAVIPILIVGWLAVEFSERVAQVISPRVHLLATFLVGIYGGFFGVAISLLIVSLVRIRYTDERSLYVTRANAIFLELWVFVIAVCVFLLYGLLSLPVALSWAAGGVIGGYVGGVVLRRTGRLSPTTQRNILRFAFSFMILEAIWATFSGASSSS